MSFPFVQLLINSLVAGSIYALVSIGFSLIFQANKFMNLAHGAIVAIGAYMALLFFSILKFSFPVAVFLSLISCSLVGFLMFKTVFSPLQKKKSSSIVLLLASVALLFVFENLLLLFFGSDVKTIKFFTVAKGLSIAGGLITPLQIIMIATSIILALATYLAMNYTNIGRNLRAVNNNPELSEVMGINKQKYLAISFIVGSILAGVAGILVGMEQQLTPRMGTDLMIKGFSGAVIGGLASVPASIAGSYFVGIAENFGIWFIPSGYKSAITFTLLFLFLLLKPNGLFGKKITRT